MSSGRLNRNRSRPIFGDLRDVMKEEISYVRLLSLESSADDEKRKVCADRMLKIMKLVLAGLKCWSATGFDQPDMTIGDLHTNHYFARMTHEAVDLLIREDSTADLTEHPEDVELEVILYRLADRELRKAGENLSEEEFVRIIGRG